MSSIATIVVGLAIAVVADVANGSELTILDFVANFGYVLTGVGAGDYIRRKNG